MRSSLFGVPENIFNQLKDIYFMLTGSIYPDQLVNDDTIQDLIIAVENASGIISNFSVGALCIPEEVRDRFRILDTQITGKVYPLSSADPEALSAILNDILVGGPVYAHWKLNENSGTIASDSSAHSRHGTLHNMEDADWLAGKLNNCLRFEGVDEYVDCGNIASFERTDSFSIEFWMKSTQLGDFRHLISRFAVNTAGWIVRLQSGKIEVCLSYIWSTSHLIRKKTIVNTYNDGNWHHVVVTYNGSSLASGLLIYVDGSNQACTVVNDLLDGSMIINTNLNLGARNNGSLVYTGYLDEVVIYSYKISDPYILYRYNSGIGREDF